MARETASGGTAGTRTDATGDAADLLRVENLNVEFPSPSGGWQTTVQDVSFSLKPGGSMALVGESGSGKTVTSIAVMGLTGATGGRIASGRSSSTAWTSPRAPRSSGGTCAARAWA